MVNVPKCQFLWLEIKRQWHIIKENEHNRMRTTGVDWSTQRKTCPRNLAWIGLWLKLDSCGERHATMSHGVAFQYIIQCNLKLTVWITQLLQHEYALEFNKNKKYFHFHNHRRRKFLFSVWQTCLKMIQHLQYHHDHTYNMHHVVHIN